MRLSARDKIGATDGTEVVAVVKASDVIVAVPDQD